MARFVPAWYGKKPVQARPVEISIEQQAVPTMVTDEGQEIHGYLADFERFRRQNSIGSHLSNEKDK